MLRNDMQPESINFPILMPGIFLATMNTLIVIYMHVCYFKAFKWSLHHLL